MTAIFGGWRGGKPDDQVSTLPQHLSSTAGASGAIADTRRSIGFVLDADGMPLDFDVRNDELSSVTILGRRPARDRRR